MRNDPSLRMSPPQRPGADGWLGTRELPGYRAGPVVVRLDHLPEVDPDHLYFDLLLLDAQGRTHDNHSGPCRALTRRHALDDRSRFVRLVAELVRHAAGDGTDLAGMHRALAFIREHGAAPDRLASAAHLLDDACSERAVVDSVQDLLALSLGEDEACRTLGDVVAELSRTSGCAPLEAAHAGLTTQIEYVVRVMGKARARHYLRHVTDFALVPRPEMFGL